MEKVRSVRNALAVGLLGGLGLSLCGMLLCDMSPATTMINGALIGIAIWVAFGLCGESSFGGFLGASVVTGVVAVAGIVALNSVLGWKTTAVLVVTFSVSIAFLAIWVKKTWDESANRKVMRGAMITGILVSLTALLAGASPFVTLVSGSIAALIFGPMAYYGLHDEEKVWGALLGMGIMMGSAISASIVALGAISLWAAAAGIVAVIGVSIAMAFAWRRHWHNSMKAMFDSSVPLVARWKPPERAK